MSIKLMSAVWDSEYAKQSHARLLVMLKLADHANDDGECYPSQETIAKKCGLARPTVNGIIKDLEQDGKLTITHTQAQNRYNLDFQNLDSSVTWGDSGNFPLSPQVTPGVSVDDSGSQRRLHKSSENHQEPSGIGEVAELTIELDEDIPKKKKSRLRNQSSLKQPSDARAKHPAILVIKGLMRRYPDKLLWDRIIARFGDEFDGDQLRDCRVAWVERGYNPNAMTWLNWYFDGIPTRQIQNGNGTNHKSFRQQRADEAKQSYERESEIRRRVAERDQQLSRPALPDSGGQLQLVEPDADGQ